MEVYADKLRRLVRLAGFKEELEMLVILSFVRGLPLHVGMALQQIDEVKTAKMQVLIDRARILVASDNKVETGVAAVVKPQREETKGRTSQQEENWRKKRPDFKETRPPIKCYQCEGPHFARNYPDLKPITCFKCGKEGHIAMYCSTSKNL